MSSEASASGEAVVDDTPYDLSDVERWVGVPLGGAQQKDPFTANDVRRFVQGLQNPNPLYFDDAYAIASRFGRLIAPQSYLGGVGGGGVLPASMPQLQGDLAGTSALFGGDEHWFYGPRVYPGDLLRRDRMLFDWRVAAPRSLGPAVITRGDTTYVNQRGEFIAKQRTTAIRYRAENARQLARAAPATVEPTWTRSEIERLEHLKMQWIRSFRDLGHEPRSWESVQVGDRLVRRVIGPHTVASFTSEYRTVQAEWGAFVDDGQLPTPSDPRLTVEIDPEAAAINLALKDPILGSPTSAAHLQSGAARGVGLPRAFGFSYAICAWIVDHLTNWAGEWGFLRHHRTRYHRPVFTGDVTFLDAEVTDRTRGPWPNRATVHLSYRMTDQAELLIASGVGEVELPMESDFDRQPAD